MQDYTKRQLATWRKRWPILEESGYRAMILVDEDDIHRAVWSRSTPDCGYTRFEIATMNQGDFEAILNAN